MYLNPPSFSYQRASRSHVFTSYLDLAFSSKLHLPTNGFFQCFPYAPKLLSTLRLGEISVWAKNFSMMCRWRSRSRGKLQRYGVDDCGYTISNSQVYSQGFLSQNFLGKTPYNFMDNAGLYSVGKGMRKNTLKEHQTMSFTGYSRLGLSRKETREIQPSMRLFRFQHVLLMWPFTSCQSQASYKLSFFNNLHQTLTHNPYIKSHNKYREMIEQKYNKI